MGSMSRHLLLNNVLSKSLAAVSCNSGRCFQKCSVAEFSTTKAVLLDDVQRSGPLDGIRVLDLSRVLAGPYCTMILGDLGAEIIKIEHPVGGDDTRDWGPPFLGSGDSQESCYFLSINRNKKSVCVNLKDERGLVTCLGSLAKLLNFLIQHHLHLSFRVLVCIMIDD